MTVVQWTGREARLLRRAMRLGQREFAAMLGISDTAVANYERPNRRDTIRLRHETQQMLDTVLARAGEDVRDRFQAAVAADRDPSAHVRGGREGPGPGPEGATSGDGFGADATDWPVWFGIRSADILNLVENHREPADTEALQAALNQELLTFDATAPDERGSGHGPSRRQALVMLAALPLGLAVGPRAAATTVEPFVRRCAASLAACWHLLKGNDLAAVEGVMWRTLVHLREIVEHVPAHRTAAARLAVQAHRICGIVALHRSHLALRAHHCRQAVRYAAAADLNSRAAALVSLASTYFYAGDPGRAARGYERARDLGAGVSDLQRSRVFAELAVVYGQLGRMRDAHRSLDLAERLYPEDPELDASYLYAEFTRASLTLEQGLAYLMLAERRPGRGYQDRAAAVFARMERAPTAAVPERIRYEIVNNQARTAVLRNDLDATEAYLGLGIRGATVLASRQRRRELHLVWQQARRRWPNERRLNLLSEALEPAPGDRRASSTPAGERT